MTPPTSIGDRRLLEMATSRQIAAMIGPTMVAIGAS